MRIFISSNKETKTHIISLSLHLVFILFHYFLFTLTFLSIFNKFFHFFSLLCSHLCCQSINTDIEKHAFILETDSYAFRWSNFYELQPKTLESFFSHFPDWNKWRKQSVTVRVAVALGRM